jgi:hypothetical protein
MLPLLFVIFGFLKQCDFSMEVYYFIEVVHYVWMAEH